MVYSHQMKLCFSVLIAVITITACSHNPKNIEHDLQVSKDTVNVEANSDLPDAPTLADSTNRFSLLSVFPVIPDTAKFIHQLRSQFNLVVDESPAQKQTEEITEFRKIKLFGSREDLILIEYDWKTGAMASYPWKYQIILTTKGTLVKIETADRFELVSVFENKSPLLFTLHSTAKGNGGHHLYKVSRDTLENIYEGYYDYEVQTYDAHADKFVFQPAELALSFQDVNNDHYTDMIFTGKKIMLGKYSKDSIWYDVENGKEFSYDNPAEIVPVRYVFLYDQKSGHFKAKNNSSY